MKKNLPEVKKSERVSRLRRPAKRMIHRAQRREVRQHLRHGEDLPNNEEDACP